MRRILLSINISTVYHGFPIPGGRPGLGGGGGGPGGLPGLGGSPGGLPGLGGGGGGPHGGGCGRCGLGGIHGFDGLLSQLLHHGHIWHLAQSTRGLLFRFCIKQAYPFSFRICLLP